MLPAVGLAHLDTGYLGDCVPFVGRLERPGQQCILAHGLGCELGVDATRPEEAELLDAGPPGCVDHVRLDLQVVAQEVRRIGVVRVDAADLGGRQEDVLRALLVEERVNCILPAQVELRAAAHDQVLAAEPSQFADDR